MARARHQRSLSLQGIDFDRVDYTRTVGLDKAAFPIGTVASDQQGQVYQYVKFTAMITSADEDVLSFPLSYTLTKPTVSATVLSSEVDAASSGLVTSIVAAAAASGGFVDAVLERRVIGATADQFAFTPTSTLPAYAWVKIRGLARKCPAVAASAGLGMSRTLSSGNFVATSGSASECQAGASLEAAAEGAADIAINLM